MSSHDREKLKQQIQADAIQTRKNLVKSVNFAVITLIDAIQLILIDFTFKKGKYRKRGAKPRPIVQKTVVVRSPAPRVIVVREGQR